MTQITVHDLDAALTLAANGNPGTILDAAILERLGLYRDVSGHRYSTLAGHRYAWPAPVSRSLDAAAELGVELGLNWHEVSKLTLSWFRLIDPLEEAPRKTLIAAFTLAKVKGQFHADP